MKKDINLRYNYDLAKTFHVNTLITKNFHTEVQRREYPEPTIEKTNHYIIKRFPLKINKHILQDNTLLNALENRESSDKFINTNEKGLEFELLSNLLHYSYGYKEKTTQKRYTPSGGARYPIFLYLAIFNVEGLDQGIYYYNALNNELQLLYKGDFKAEIKNNTFFPELIQDSSLVIINVGSLKDSCSKYGNIGYKLLCMDLGHVSQNIYLLSSSLFLKCRNVLGIENEFFNDLLNLDGVEESALNIHIIGQ